MEVELASMIRHSIRQQVSCHLRIPEVMNVLAKLLNGARGIDLHTERGCFAPGTVKEVSGAGRRKRIENLSKRRAPVIILTCAFEAG